jgi:hypothetical protein
VILTDFCQYIYAFWFSWSQRLLNYLTLNYFSLKVALNTINLTKPKSNAKIVETGKIDTLKRQRHAGSLFLVGTATSINSGGIK